MRSRILPIVIVSVVLCFADVVRAQACDPSAQRPAPGSCAFGYACANGACAPVCDPECPSGQLCAAPGICSPAATTDPATTQPATTDPAATQPPTTQPPTTQPATTPAVTEDTADACRNGLDDDGDGLADCAESGCSLFVFCQQPPSAAAQSGAVVLPAGVGSAPGAVLTPGRSTVAPLVPAEAPREERQPVFALTLNLGGAASFGPSLALELGGIVTFSLFGRAMNAGVLNYLLADEHSTWRDDEYVLGVGAGAAIRLYLGPGMRGMRGFWLGLAGEYQLNQWRKTDWYEDTSHSVVPTFQLGWRWIFGSFVLGVGASMGYRVEIDSEVTFGSEACETCRDDVFEGSGLFYLLHLEIGFAV